MSAPAQARESDAGSFRSPGTISTGRPARLSRGLPGRTRQRTSRPRAKSARTTWAPTNPVPPVTRFGTIPSAQKVPSGHAHHVARALPQLGDDGRLEPRVHRAVLAPLVHARFPVAPVHAGPELLPRLVIAVPDQVAGALPSLRRVGHGG